MRLLANEELNNGNMDVSWQLYVLVLNKWADKWVGEMSLDC